MNLDDQLKNLIAEVCQYPNPSLERQKALNRLLILVQHLPGLMKSSNPDYLDALNRTWEWFGKQIHTFQPRPPSLQVSLVKWINGYLYWRIQDLYKSDNSIYSLDAVNEGELESNLLDKLSERGFSTPIPSGLEGYIEQLQKQETQRIGLQLEQYIEQDTDQKLQKCHPKAHPNCNCLLLTHRLRLKDPPDKFADVTRDLNVNYQVLVAHWKRKCLPLLQEIALSLGYQPNSSHE